MTNRIQLAPPPLPKFDAATARKFLSYILDTEAGVTEIRLFRAWKDRSGYIVPADHISATLAGWYDRIHEMIADLGKLKGVSAYITINPVNPDLFARCANQLKKMRNTTSDADIVVFRWLYIDIDPKRPADISSTDEELAAAVEVRDRILAAQPALADAAIWGKSGNGAWILVMLPDYLPEEGHDLAVQALAWISTTYSTEAVKIDVSTKNPSRVGVIPGTVKCKGDHVAGRPHRLATLDSPDRDPAEMRPCDLRAWIAAVGADQSPAAQPGRKRGRRKIESIEDIYPCQTPPGDGDFEELLDRGSPSGAIAEWAEEALASEIRNVETCTQERNNRLNTSALKLGEIIAAGALSRSDVETALLKAAERCGLGYEESVATIRSGLNAGEKNPRDLSHIGRKAIAGTNGHTNGDTHVISVPPQSAKKSSLVQVTPLELIVNDAVAEHLHNHQGLYQRNYRLVEVATETRDHRRHQFGSVPPGMPTIVPLALSRLREIISSVVTFRSGVKVIHPPDWCASAVLHRQRWPQVPTLCGIVEHPIMRHDGSIANVAGYDEATETLFVGEEAFLPPPDHPSKEEAREAARRIMAVVAEFPFHRDPDSTAEFSSHQAAWLACLMTILLRHLIDDAVPLFLIEATAAGSGKTLLCDLISRIATGRDMVRSAYYHDPVEMDKRITSTAMGGIRVTLMDNVSGAFGNSSLDNALTGRLYQGRTLGQLSMTPPLILDTVFVATGNNLNFHGDLFRRIVPCRLESPYERPDKDKTDFALKDIRRHVLDHRPRLLRDTFTVARAYIQAGYPYEPLPANTYGDWVRLIQGMIVWVLDADPMEGQQDLAEADVFRAARAALIEGFAEMLLRLGKTKMTGGQILSALKNAALSDQFTIIREGISALWSNEFPSSGSLGKRLMGMRNARVGCYKLVKAGLNKRAAEWTLLQMDKDTRQWGPLRTLEVAAGTNEDIPEIVAQDLRPESDFTGEED